MCRYPWQPQRVIAPMDYKYTQRSAIAWNPDMDHKYSLCSDLLMLDILNYCFKFLL